MAPKSPLSAGLSLKLCPDGNGRAAGCAWFVWRGYSLVSSELEVALEKNVFGIAGRRSLVPLFNRKFGHRSIHRSGRQSRPTRRVRSLLREFILSLRHLRGFAGI